LPNRLDHSIGLTAPALRCARNVTAHNASASRKNGIFSTSNFLKF